MHPLPRAYFLPRAVYHDGEPTTLQRALRRGADPTALEVDDGQGGRAPYLRLTPAQLAYLAGLKSGPAALTSRVAQRLAASLVVRGLVRIDEATVPGEPDAVAILPAGVETLGTARR